MVPIPEAIHDGAVRAALLRDHALEIGDLGDFAGRVWRIGLMGQGDVLATGRDAYTA